MRRRKQSGFPRPILLQKTEDANRAGPVAWGRKMDREISKMGRRERRRMEAERKTLKDHEKREGKKAGEEETDDNYESGKKDDDAKDFSNIDEAIDSDSSSGSDSDQENPPSNPAPKPQVKRVESISKPLRNQSTL